VAVSKVLQRVLSGTADAAIRFDDLCRLLENLGFEKRVRGSHHLFEKNALPRKSIFSGMAPKPGPIKSNKSGL
jgi:predicted RNA binding protein YcfA (HicA-like mRNA interferase family)